MPGVIESPIFPLTVNFGARFGPKHDVDIVVTDGGKEYRTVNAAQPKLKASVSLHAARDARIATMRKWIYIAQGPARAFRVRDPMDYTVPDNNGAGGLTKVSGTANTAGAVYQMEKWYTLGSETFKRTIVKPTVGATRIYDNASALKSLTTNYLIDESTGLVTLVTNFTPGSWRGTFEVLMRFDLDEHEFEAVDRDGDSYFQGIDEIPLVEVLFP